MAQQAIGLAGFDLPPPSAGERRRGKRHLSQQITLTFLGTDHVALNWSLGGVLVDDRHSTLALGADISGIMTIRGVEGRFRFAAELARRDARTKEVAFRFVNPSRALSDALARLTE